MILFVVTSLSDLMIDELIKHEDSLVITDKKEIFDFSLSIGRKAIITNKRKHGDFKEEFMPGMLSGIEHDGLEVWKSLSLDRLFFWREQDSVLLNQIEYDELVVSLDLYSSLPWQFALCTAVDVTAVKTHSIMTREMISFLKHKLFENAIVSYDDEVELLKRHQIRSVAKIGKRPIEIPTDDTIHALQAGFAVSDATTCVVCAKEDLWQFEKFVKDEGPTNVVVFAPDERSKELFYDIFGGVPCYTDKRILPACGRVVSFRFYDDIWKRSRTNTIIDYCNINMTKEIIGQ